MKKILIISAAGLVIVGVIVAIFVMFKMEHDKIMAEGVDTQSVSAVVESRRESHSTGTGNSRRTTYDTVYYVEYSYEANGRGYEISSQKFQTKSSAEARKAEGTVTIRYLEENPDRAILFDAKK